MSIIPIPPSEKTAFEHAKNRVILHLKRLLKRTQKQIFIREKTLLDCQNWEDVHHKALLLQSNLYRIKKGLAEITLEDWAEEGKACTLLLDPIKDPKDQVAALFRQARKLRLGIPHSEKQLHLIVNALSAQEELISHVQNINSITALDAFLIAHPSAAPQEHQILIKKFEPTKPYHTYTSESGLSIWVGKNATKNDLLTFHHANGLDWWLHAHNYPGSHVIIRVLRKGEDPDSKTILDAAELALRYSKAKDTHGEGEVTVSQVKFLHRLKGCPGKVQVSKHRVMYIRLDPVRWNRLRGIS
ncbi:MAG: DUF814 domain-containing protein [Parachlamydiaceae bacterium]|nr:DUF814 domain-containing protein [Parachlamydiaceae bacterium]